MAIGPVLVLGGGGVAGIAWMTGLLAGLADAGQDVTGADLVIGTSAGATVAAQLGGGLTLDELYARQVEPALQSRELAAGIDMAEFAASLRPYLAGVASSDDMTLRFGRFALEARTVTEADRRAVIESRLPSAAWPATPTKLIAVDCASGKMAAFDATSGVSLVDAVAASCAVPGVWPPVSIGGRRYMDGGVRSADNADLAVGAQRVVVISPMGVGSAIPTALPLRDVVAGLRQDGASVRVISPDAASAAAIGTSRSTRKPARLPPGPGAHRAGPSRVPLDEKGAVAWPPKDGPALRPR